MASRYEVAKESEREPELARDLLDQGKLESLANEFRDYADRISKIGQLVEKTDGLPGVLLHTGDLRNKFMRAIEGWLDRAEVDAKDMARAAERGVLSRVESSQLQSLRRKEKAEKTPKTKKAK